MSGARSHVWSASVRRAPLHTRVSSRAAQGLNSLDYKEHIDYDVVISTNPAFNKAIVRINVFRHHRQAGLYVPATLPRNHRSVPGRRVDTASLSTDMLGCQAA